MTYAKIRLPKTDVATEAFAVLAKEFRLVGVREQGEILYQLPTSALDRLDQMAVPYEVLDSNLAYPVGPMGVH